MYVLFRLGIELYTCIDPQPTCRNLMLYVCIYIYMYMYTYMYIQAAAPVLFFKHWLLWIDAIT